MYDAVECNEIKTYLRRAGKSIAEWMILDNDEEALIQFLKKDIITVNTIDKLMPQMDAAEMVNAKAYALEYIRKNTKEKSFRIWKSAIRRFFAAGKKIRQKFAYTGKSGILYI